MKRKVKRIMVAIFAMAFCITSVPVKAAVNNKIIVQQKKTIILLSHKIFMKEKVIGLHF